MLITLGREKVRVSDIVNVGSVYYVWLDLDKRFVEVYENECVRRIFVSEREYRLAARLLFLTGNLASELTPEESAALPGWGIWVIDSICVRDNWRGGDAMASFGVYFDECRKIPALDEACPTNLTQAWLESPACKGLAADIHSLLWRVSAPWRSLREALAGDRHD